MSAAGQDPVAQTMLGSRANAATPFLHLHHLSIISLDIHDKASRPFFSPATFSALCSLEVANVHLLRDKSTPTPSALVDSISSLAPQITTLLIDTSDAPILGTLPSFTSLEALGIRSSKFGEGTASAFFDHLPPAPLRHLHLPNAFANPTFLDAFEADSTVVPILEKIYLSEGWMEWEGWERMQEICARRKIGIELSEADSDGVEWWKRMGRPGGARKVL